MEASEKRIYIIKKCYKLLLIKGFDGVSISDIQKECNVARGLLYHYFGSKEELFYEVVSKMVFPRFKNSMDETSNLNLRETLMYICNKYHEICIVDELKGVSLLNYDFLIYRAIQENEEIKAQYENIQHQERELIKRAIQQSIANNEMRNDIDPSALAHFITSLIDGVWLNSLSLGNPTELIKQLEDMLALNLRLLEHN